MTPEYPQTHTVFTTCYYPRTEPGLHGTKTKTAWDQFSDDAERWYRDGYTVASHCMFNDPVNGLLVSVVYHRPVARQAP